VNDRVLIIDKPAGPTSHDIVAKVRRLSGIRRVGHAGTLDPRATGVLVVLVGKTTRLSSYLMDHDKSYCGRIELGVETTTQDGEGDVVSRRDASGVTLLDIERAASSFVGDILQVPPMVSAIKQAGRPLYELARKGVSVERKARPVTVSSLEVMRYESPYIDFELDCSRGTYVRTIAADIGTELGCGAYLAELRRTRVGAFTLEQAVTLQELLSAGDEWPGLGLPAVAALPEMDLVELNDTQSERVMEGGATALEVDQAADVSTEKVRLSEDGATLLAIARVTRQRGKPSVQPERVFVPPI